MESHLENEMVVLPSQVEVLWISVVCNSIKDVFPILIFQSRLEGSFSLNKGTEVPLSNNCAIWWFDLENHVLIPNICINVATNIFQFVDFWDWIVLRIRDCHSADGFESVTINLEDIRWTIRGVKGVVFTVCLFFFILRDSPSFFHSCRQIELIFRFKSISVQNEHFILLPCKHSELMSIAWTHPFTKDLTV